MILTLWSSKLSNGHCSIFTWLGKVYGGRNTILCLLCVIVKAIGSNALVTALCRSYRKDLEENQWEGLKESTETFWQCHAAFLMCGLSSITFFFICSGFCHTLKWNSHGFTCVPHPDPPSHLPLHPLSLGLPSAPGPSACLIHSTWAGDLFHPRLYTCFNAVLLEHPTLAFCHTEWSKPER